MRHKVYRFCLLSVAIIAIIGGIFYYLNFVQEDEVKEGTLVSVEQELSDEQCALY